MPPCAAASLRHRRRRDRATARSSPVEWHQPDPESRKRYRQGPSRVFPCQRTPIAESRCSGLYPNLESTPRRYTSCSLRCSCQG
eukprot:3128160-Rhodomonas_salina.2